MCEREYGRLRKSCHVRLSSYLVNLAHLDPARKKQAFSLGRCHTMSIKLYNFLVGTLPSPIKVRTGYRQSKILMRAVWSTPPNAVCPTASTWLTLHTQEGVERIKLSTPF
ncbi:hypothetical protein HBH52_041200 [Parastagonospora nodorum]|nr:hypothetical protein HBH52_041200 [Parastagonospora nodorum]